MGSGRGGECRAARLAVVDVPRHGPNNKTVANWETGMQSRLRRGAKSREGGNYGCGAGGGLRGWEGRGGEGALG